MRSVEKDRVLPWELLRDKLVISLRKDIVQSVQFVIGGEGDNDNDFLLLLLHAIVEENH